MQIERSGDNLPCAMGTADRATPKCHCGSELHGQLQMASDCLSSHFKQQWGESSMLHRSHHQT